MKQVNTLKEYRKIRSLTQLELAENSGISIRTIQRIEKGLSSGSPHTIKTLAKALNVESSDIAISKEENTVVYDDFHKVKLINFSILVVLLIPFGNLILPTILFFCYKSNKHVNSLGRRILSIQLLSTFILSGLSIITFLVMSRGNGAIPIPVPIIYAMYTIANILIVIKTTIAIDKNKKILKFFPDLI
jgi:transcriptional regulator with XRE-family HTH domain